MPVSFGFYYGQVIITRSFSILKFFYKSSNPARLVFKFASVKDQCFRIAWCSSMTCLLLNSGWEQNTIYLCIFIVVLFNVGSCVVYIFVHEGIFSFCYKLTFTHIKFYCFSVSWQIIIATLLLWLKVFIQLLSIYRCFDRSCIRCDYSICIDVSKKHCRSSIYVIVM